MDIALQIRQNAKEYQDAVSDLMSWEKDIKQKDASVRKMPTKASAPPMRGSSSISSSNSSSTPAPPKTQKIKSSDYRAWDKFDVDKALADVDYAVETQTVKSQSGQDSGVGPGIAIDDVNRIEEALIQKEKGNAYFKKGDYKKALVCYTKSMKLDPSNVIPIVNRAMVFLKLEKYQEAEADCSEALNLQPKNVKAFWRRGIARKNLGYLRDGYEDVKTALVLEPGNASIKKEVQDIELELAKTEKIFPKSITDQTTRKESRRRRIHIQDVGEWKEVKDSTPAADLQDHTPEISPAAEKQDAKKTVNVESESKQPTSEISSSPKADAVIPSIISIDKPKASGSKPTSQKPVIDVKQSDILEPQQPSKTIEISSEDVAKLAPVTSPENTILAKETPQIEVVKTNTNSESLSVSKPPSSSLEAQIPEKPKTMYEFERDWKSLRNNSERLYLYLKNIQPDEYVKLFKSSFESHYMTRMLEIIRDYYIPRETPDATLQFLTGITKVPRFNMVSMFLSRADKQALNTILLHLNETYPDQVINLRKAYGIKN